MSLCNNKGWMGKTFIFVLVIRIWAFTDRQQNQPEGGGGRVDKAKGEGRKHQCVATVRALVLTCQEGCSGAYLYERISGDRETPEDQCLVSYPTQPCVACFSQVCLPRFCPDGRTQAGTEAFCSDFPYETWKEKYRCFRGQGGPCPLMKRHSLW